MSMRRRTRLNRNKAGYESAAHWVDRRPFKRLQSGGRLITKPQPPRHRRTRPYSAWLGAVLLIVVAAWLGWQIVSNTQADTFARSQPERALAWQPRTSAALTQLAERQLGNTSDGTDLKAVEALAKRALSTTPLADLPLRQLASVAERRGNDRLANQLMRLAETHNLRDPIVQIWLYNRRLQDGDYPAAFNTLDVLLRTRPERQNDIFAAAIALAAVPAAADSLAKLIASNPPWRDRFLLMLARKASSPAEIQTVYSALESSSHPPTLEEIRPYLDRLIADGLGQQAYLVWLQWLPSERAGPIDYLYNGDFEYQPNGLPFDWTLSNIKGAEAAIIALPESNGEGALRIDFSGARVRYQHISHMLALPPGEYRLTGSVRAEDLQSDRGLNWRLFCAEGQKQVLLETNRVNDSRSWSKFGGNFDVPESDCDVQNLRLELAARTALEQQIDGTIWYRDMRITRLKTKPQRSHGTK